MLGIWIRECDTSGKALQSLSFPVVSRQIVCVCGGGGGPDYLGPVKRQLTVSTQH